MAAVSCPQCSKAVETFGVAGKMSCPHCQQPFVIRAKAKPPPLPNSGQLRTAQSTDASASRNLLPPVPPTFPQRAFSDAGHTTSTKSAADFHRIVVSQAARVLEPGVAGYLETRLREHLTRYGDSYYQADLRLHVVEYDPGSQVLRYLVPFLAGAATVVVTMSGTVNGAPVEQRVAASRYVGVFGGSSNTLARSCLDQCLTKIEIALGVHLDRPPATYSKFLTRLRLINCLVAAAASTTFAFLYPWSARRLAREPSQFVWVFYSLVIAVATYGVISMAALLFAPRSFLTDDPQGRQLLRRVGVSTPSAARLIAALLLGISLFAFTGSIWAIFEHR